MRQDIQKMPFFQRGLSLIELMIAMVLGLLLMSGVVSIFLSAKQGYVNQDATSQLQENARFALEMMTREIRMVGYGGCSDAISVANALESYSGLADEFSIGLRGYEGDATNSTFPPTLKANAQPNTDAIIVHTVDTSGELSVTGHQPSSAKISLSTPHSIQKGDILLMVDANCSNMAIFAYTGPTNGGNSATIAVHNTGNLSGFSYKNCTKALKGNFDCDDMSGAQSVAYSPGSSVFSIESFAYYIGESSLDPTINSLYRLDMDDNSEELVEGIDNLEIYYGVASGANIQYRKAGLVAAAQWPEVKSVRLILTSSSLTLVGGQPLTKTFTATVKIRNRGEA
tara:strand:+ start:1314 stop:2336 length:1023 start_codon:yes stop_codon:yes gene_type:complete